MRCALLLPLLGLIVCTAEGFDLRAPRRLHRTTVRMMSKKSDDSSPATHPAAATTATASFDGSARAPAGTHVRVDSSGRVFSTEPLAWRVVGVVGRSAREVVAGTVALTLLVRRDAPTLMWIVGAILNATLSKLLKRLINEARRGVRHDASSSSVARARDESPSLLPHRHLAPLSSLFSLPPSLRSRSRVVHSGRSDAAPCATSPPRSPPARDRRGAPLAEPAGRRAPGRPGDAVVARDEHILPRHDRRARGMRV